MGFELFFSKGYQWIAGSIIILGWLFNIESRSKDNASKLEILAEDVNEVQKELVDVSRSVDRMEAMYETTKDSVNRIEGRFDRMENKLDQVLINDAKSDNLKKLEQ